MGSRRSNAEVYVVRPRVETETGGEWAEIDGIDSDGSDAEEQKGERKPIFVRAPREPSKEERDEHCLTHLPYRSWCRHCVRGRGREWPHRKVEEDVRARASCRSLFSW